MSNIPGTNVAAMIVPFDTADIYATHNDKYGRGGFRVVDTLAERDAITDLRRKEGMWVRVLSNEKLYELWGGTENINWREVTLGSSSESQLSQVSTGIIATTNSVTVDSLPLESFITVKWILAAESEDGRLYQCEISSMARGTYPFFCKYAIMGDRMDLPTKIQIVNGALKLTVTNNEPVGVTFTVLRLPIMR